MNPLIFDLIRHVRGLWMSNSIRFSRVLNKRVPDLHHSLATTDRRIQTGTRDVRRATTYLLVCAGTGEIRRVGAMFGIVDHLKIKPFRSVEKTMDPSLSKLYPDLLENDNHFTCI